MSLSAASTYMRSSLPRQRKVLQSAQVLFVFAISLGGAYLGSFAAARAGFAVSRNLLFEGSWYAPSWQHFPLLDCIVMLVFMFLLPLLWARFRCSGILSPRLPSLRRFLFFSLLGVLGGVIIYAVRAATRPSENATIHPNSILILSTYFLVVALAEEATFRGLLQGGLESACSIYVALPIALAAFVLWHGLAQPGTALLFRAAEGLLLGLLYWRSRSLIPPILCHWLTNIALIV